MRVLVTGAEGQLGSALSTESPVGVSCICASRGNLDITSDEMPAKIADFEPDLIINAAAYNAVDQAEENRDQAFAVNSTAVGQLAQLGIPLVHISTDYVFDGTINRPLRPDDMPNPVNIYGQSKWAGEKVALDHGALVVRTSSVYAAHHKNFVTSIYDQLKKANPLRVVQDQISAPTHAPSLARAVWSLVTSKKTGLYHFTDDGTASRYDLAIAIASEAINSGLLNGPADIEPISTNDFPALAKRPAYSVLDCSDCWAEIGKPAYWKSELRSMFLSLR